MQKRLMLTSFLILCGLIVAGSVYYRHSHTPQASTPRSATVAAPNSQNTTVNPQPKAFDKTAHSLTDPASIWIIVNKTHAIPTTYKPSDIVSPNIPLGASASAEQMHVSGVMAASLENLVNAASKQGVSLRLLSGYRSASLQSQLYESYVSKDGQAAADTYSARPGTSEHQTGLAADLGASNGVCDLETCFGKTPEGVWLAANAHAYGFVIRYPDGKQSITGYQYEPWHIRYVGIDLTGQLHDSGQTLEEFFGYN